MDGTRLYFRCFPKWETYRALVPASTQLVRRATGGGLVSHLEDWTFAVVLPSGHPLCEAEAMASYEAVHQALAEALRAQGQPVNLAPSLLVPDPFSRLITVPNALSRMTSCAPMTAARSLARQKRTRHGLLLEGYIWRPFLPGCDWNRFEKDFPAALGQVLNSPPVAVAEPIYDQHDHEETWARFNSVDWNQRI